MRRYVAGLPIAILCTLLHLVHPFASLVAFCVLGPLPSPSYISFLVRVWPACAARNTGGQFGSSGPGRDGFAPSFFCQLRAHFPQVTTFDGIAKRLLHVRWDRCQGRSTEGVGGGPPSPPRLRTPLSGCSTSTSSTTATTTNYTPHHFRQSLLAGYGAALTIAAAYRASSFDRN